MEIFPCEGIGPIKFGMTPKEVENAIGIDQVYEEWMGGNLNDSLFYPGVIVGFSECNAKGPLSNSVVIEFRVNPSEHITLNGIPTTKLNVENISNIVINNENPTVESNGDVLYKENALSLGFLESGSLWGIEMWDCKNS